MGSHGNRIAGALVAAGLAVTTIGVASSSVSADKPPEYTIDEEELAEQIAELELATGQEVLSGEIAGATWIGQVPDNWNGDLIIWAHGCAGEGTTLGVGTPPARTSSATSPRRASAATSPSGAEAAACARSSNPARSRQLVNSLRTFHAMSS